MSVYPRHPIKFLETQLQQGLLTVVSDRQFVQPGASGWKIRPATERYC